jgi:hypothetical protein
MFRLIQTTTFRCVRPLFQMPGFRLTIAAADQSLNENATQDDIARLIQSIRLRDDKIVSVETDLRRVADDYRRLREELLPVFKIAKDKSQPLPPPDGYHDGQPATSPLGDRYGAGVFRSYSRRAYTGGTTPKNNSPTHIPPSILENRPYNDGAALDPSTAAHLNGGSHSSPGMPSPTSPNAQFTQQTLASRSYMQPPPNTSRNIHEYPPDDNPPVQRPERLNPTPTQQSRADPPPRVESRAGADPPSVEIFKSFRVSLEDPCHKVLPAALKKYNINADWKQYALYIVYGDQERCLALDERPLILFKQLDKEGKKPMFMLRRNLHPMDNIYPNAGGAGAGAGAGAGSGPGPGPGGSAPNSAAAFDASRQAQINLPGGVL